MSFMAFSEEEKERILYCDYSPLADITEQVREQNRSRLFVGGVRINNALYRTKKEDAKYRKESLLRKLP
jgi:hypothetical protein